MDRREFRPDTVDCTLVLSNDAVARESVLAWTVGRLKTRSRISQAENEQTTWSEGSVVGMEEWRPRRSGEDPGKTSPEPPEYRLDQRRFTIPCFPCSEQSYV